MAWHASDRPSIGLANARDPESPNPAMVVAPRARAGVLALPHLLLDDDLEWDDHSDELRGTFALIIATVLLWPLSLLVIPAALGCQWRRTVCLLGNLAYFPQTSWVAAARAAPSDTMRQWLSDRTRIALLHHGTTILYLSAVAAWAAAGGVSLPGDDAPPAAVVTHAMLGFQLLTTGAAIAARRLAFATLVTVRLELSTAPRAMCRGITQHDLTPLFTVANIRGFAEQFVIGVTAIFAVDRRLRCSVGTDHGAGALVISVEAYECVRTYVRALGLPGPPPLDVLRAQQDGALALPSGHVVARCVAAPRWRCDVVAGLLPPSPAPPGASTRGDVTTDVSVLMCVNLFVVGVNARLLTGLAACIMTAGAVATAVPWIVRRSLIPSAVAGASPAEAAAFVLLTLVDAILVLQVDLHGGIASTAQYSALSLGAAELLTRITPSIPRGAELSRDAVGTPTRLARTRRPAVRPPARGDDVAQVVWVPVHANVLESPLMRDGFSGEVDMPAGPATRARLQRAAQDALQGESRRRGLSGAK